MTWLPWSSWQDMKHPPTLKFISDRWHHDDMTSGLLFYLWEGQRHSSSVALQNVLLMLHLFVLFSHYLIFPDLFFCSIIFFLVLIFCSECRLIRSLWCGGCMNSNCLSLSVSVQLVAQGQFRVLKVPLGFIKALEWVSPSACSTDSTTNIRLANKHQSLSTLMKTYLTVQ